MQKGADLIRPWLYDGFTIAYLEKKLQDGPHFFVYLNNRLLYKQKNSCSHMLWQDKYPLHFVLLLNVSSRADKNKINRTLLTGIAEK